MKKIMNDSIFQCVQAIKAVKFMVMIGGIIQF